MRIYKNIYLHIYCFEDEEIVDANDSKKEDGEEVSVSLSKPNDNQLSLSMFVNADDVQDDLDEDLKEIEKKKVRKQYLSECLLMFS